MNPRNNPPKIRIIELGIYIYAYTHVLSIYREIWTCIKQLIPFFRTQAYIFHCKLLKSVNSSYTFQFYLELVILLLLAYMHITLEEWSVERATVFPVRLKFT